MSADFTPACKVAQRQLTAVRGKELQRGHNRPNDLGALFALFDSACSVVVAAGAPYATDKLAKARLTFASGAPAMRCVHRHTRAARSREWPWLRHRHTCARLRRRATRFPHVARYALTPCLTIRNCIARARNFEHRRWPLIVARTGPHRVALDTQ